MQPPLWATMTIGPTIRSAARSIAATRASRSRFARPIGATA
jgi:hypothetical protein